MEIMKKNLAFNVKSWNGFSGCPFCKEVYQGAFCKKHLISHFLFQTLPAINDLEIPQQQIIVFYRLGNLVQKNGNIVVKKRNLCLAFAIDLEGNIDFYKERGIKDSYSCFHIDKVPKGFPLQKPTGLKVKEKTNWKLDFIPLSPIPMPAV